MMSSSRRVSLVICTLLGILCACVAGAVDYYVNPLAGSDENSGLSAEQAFKTITYTLEVIRAENATPATVHLAAGTYSADTNGETFPLRMTSATSLLGEGPELTRLVCRDRDIDCISCDAIADIVVAGLSIDGPPSAPFGSRGGAISLDNCCGEVSIRDCVMTFSSGISCQVTYGREDQCTMDVENCYVEGGLGCANEATVRFCTIVGTELWGGNTEITIEDSSFVDATLALWASSAEVRRCSFYGGSISLEDGRNLIEKCKLIGGGGILIDYYAGVPSSSTVIRDCLIAENDDNALRWRVIAPYNRSGCLAACLSGSDVREYTLDVSNCVLIDNERGVAMCLEGWPSTLCSGVMQDCRIIGGHHNPGISIGTGVGWGPHVSIVNSLISGNSGGGIDCFCGNELDVEGCTILDNGAGWYDSLGRYQPSVGGVHTSSTREATVRNCILRNNRTELSQSGSSFSVRYCCVEGGYPGVRNFGADPIFASGPLGDYYLSSVEAGQHTDSLCIDAGSTSASIAGVNYLTTRTDGAFDSGLVDIGYHYAATPPTIEASIAGAGASAMHAKLPRLIDVLGGITPWTMGEPALVPGEALSAQVTSGGEKLCHLAAAAGRTKAAQADEAPVLGPGDVLRAQVTVANDAWPIWVDLYAAFVAADGTVFCITPDGLTTDFTAYAIDVLLDEGLHFGPASVFEFTLNEHVAPGDYLFAAALSRAREPFRPIGSVAFARFKVEWTDKSRRNETQLPASALLAGAH